jgi:hypothetical protein
MYKPKYKTLMKHQKIYMTMYLHREIFLAGCILSCSAVVRMTTI